MTPAIFKAYDIRGRYPDEINEKAVAAIARAIAKKLKGPIVLGHDARLSSLTLYKAVLGNVPQPIAVGLMTTPVLYFLVNKLQARGGIMITASHNPKDYNGLKIVGPKAAPISGTTIKKWLDQSATI